MILYSFCLGRLLFRERQTQIPQTDQPTATEALHRDTSEIKMDTKSEEQLSSMHEGSTSEENQSKCTDSASTDEPMETQPATDDKIIAEPDDDEQPKSKLTARPHGSHTDSTQSNISTNQMSASTTVGGVSSDEDLPYFPAHPISYFPEEAESSASASVARQPSRAGPRSMFDREISLYAISEDEPALMPTLESFQVRTCTCRCDYYTILASTMVCGKGSSLRNVPFSFLSCSFLR